MNKRIITFLIAFNIIYCTKIKVDITFVEPQEKNYTFDFIPNESNTAKDFINQIKAQSISYTFAVSWNGAVLDFMSCL